MEPIFRIATESEAEILLDGMREYHAFDGHAFDKPKAREALLAFLRDPSLGRAWLVCEEEILVGYIVLTFGYSLEYLGRDAFIDELYLCESHRGRGWGRKALHFVEEQHVPLASGRSIWKSFARTPRPARCTVEPATSTTTIT